MGMYTKKTHRHWAAWTIDAPRVGPSAAPSDEMAPQTVTAVARSRVEKAASSRPREDGRTSALPIPLVLIDGKTLATIGDAGAYLSRLSAEQLEKHHWKVAIKLLDSALKEPRYLYAANVTLQTALILDGLAEAGKA